ncbi:MAG: NAD-dependent protein deacylase [Butyrivibrio sp.]
MTESQKTLAEWIKLSDNIVFFGGAGVSTESNIPDFRSVDGLYNQKYAYPPETILSHSFFMKKTEEFFRFYKDKMIYLDAVPNKAHIALARLEAMGKCRAVITQNIDGLHQAAGSHKVLELHGSVLRNYCMSCKAFYGVDFVCNSEGIPRCRCGGIVKPDVVLYEEGLNQDTISESVDYIRKADVLIVAGTSLTVYPAAGLIDYYRGDKLVLINKSSTPKDSCADLIINEAVGETLWECMQSITQGE